MTTLSRDRFRKNCQHCGHPVLQPVLSVYCTNCGKLTGVPKPGTSIPFYDPMPDELLFEVKPILGKSYKFFSEKFAISKGSRQLEEIPYSMVEDCEAEFQTDDDTFTLNYYSAKITMKLKENPIRYIELNDSPVNEKLGMDLAGWLNSKLAENEARSSEI